LSRNARDSPLFAGIAADFCSRLTVEEPGQSQPC
jgi:hypothetical protein